MNHLNGLPNLQARLTKLYNQRAAVSSFGAPSQFAVNITKDIVYPHCKTSLIYKLLLVKQVSGDGRNFVITVILPGYFAME